MNLYKYPVAELRSALESHVCRTMQVTKLPIIPLYVLLETLGTVKELVSRIL